jgi:putative aldouronate transport system substrate-binding protein
MRKVSWLVLLVLLLPLAAWASGGGETTGSAQGVKLSNPGAYPIVSPKIELNFTVPTVMYIEDYATNEVTKHMEELTGIHVKFSTIPNDAEAISLSLASGQYPDVYFYNWTGITNAQLEQYGAGEKVFLELEKLIRDRAPNAVKAIQKVPNGWGLAKSTDGKIYSMPRIDVCQHCEYSAKMWVNQVWLDKLGMKQPTTTDEFYKMLVAFKTKDPNGNGKADEIPLIGAISGWQQFSELFLMNSFLYYDIGNYGYYVDKGTVKNALTQDAYREGLRYMRKLYAEGLLYEGSFTQDNTVVTKIIESEEAPIVGATPAGFPGMFATQVGDDRARMFRPISPLKGPSGVQLAPFLYWPVSLGGMVLTRNNKYPEATVQWADFFYTLEGSLWTRWGAKDKAWRWPTAGELGYDGEPALWAEIRPWNVGSSNPQNLGYMDVGVWNFDDLFRPGMAIDTTVDLWTAKSLERMLYVVTKQYYRPYAKNDMALPPLKFTGGEQTEVATLTTEVKKYADKSLFDFVSGNLSIDSDWARYLDGLERAGLSRLQKFYQGAYDKQFK